MRGSLKGKLLLEAPFMAKVRCCNHSFNMSNVQAKTRKRNAKGRANAPPMAETETQKSHPPSSNTAKVSKVANPSVTKKAAVTPSESIAPSLGEGMALLTVSEDPASAITLPAAPLPASQRLQLALRPKLVDTAEFLRCTVNHYPLTISADTVYQFQVTITPTLEQKRLRFSLLEQHRDVLGTQYLFDGESLMFTTFRVEDQSLECLLYGKSYGLTIQQTRRLLPQDIPKQVYALLFRKVLRELDLTPLGRQHYRPQDAIKMPAHKMELWPGYFTSVHNTMRGATLCADLAHKVIRTDTVLDMMYDEWDVSGNTVRADQNLSELLEGQIVLTRYNNRTYRIDKIEWDLTPLTTFDWKGNQSTFVQYYKSVYKLGVRNMTQPLLKHVDRRSGQEVLLVPELCYLTGLTDNMRKDFRLMTDLAAHTRVEPVKRFKELGDFSNSIRESTPVQEALSEWNVKSSAEPLKVKGRQIPPEAILMGKKSVNAGPSASWNVNSLTRAVPVRKSILVYPSDCIAEAGELLSQIKVESERLGIAFAKPVEVKIQRDDASHFEKAIRQGVTKDTALVICMLKYDGAQSYAMIKQVCCHQLGIPSQCVKSKTMGMRGGQVQNTRKVQSIVTKIVQQINCKLGGESWNVQIPAPLSKMMIVGIDVCHDTQSNKGRGKRSVVGFTATTNSQFTKYFSTVKFQDVGQEIVDQLSACFGEAMENFKSLNGFYPQEVIVYRDGVGEGQFLEVFQYEVPQLRQILLSKNSAIKLTFVIVQKRIHTRIFDHPRGGVKNPLPGTVVDNGCTDPEMYDFFMVNQSVTQGTATPTHYHVILDEVNLPPANLQLLTFKLGHLYFNWAGTIRVPAPCQYAHKIAFLVGQAVHAAPHPSLSNLLHFL